MLYVCTCGCTRSYCSETSLLLYVCFVFPLFLCVAGGKPVYLILSGACMFSIILEKKRYESNNRRAPKAGGPPTLGATGRERERRAYELARPRRSPRWRARPRRHRHVLVLGAHRDSLPPCTVTGSHGIFYVTAAAGWHWRRGRVCSIHAIGVGGRWFAGAGPETRERDYVLSDS